MKHLVKKIVLAALFLFSIAFTAPAQCPMCKIGAESNLKNGGTAGNGLNTGILYMLAAPYLMVGTLGFLWYKNRKKEAETPDA